LFAEFTRNVALQLDRDWKLFCGIVAKEHTGYHTCQKDDHTKAGATGVGI